MAWTGGIYTHTNAKLHKWFIIIMQHNNRADWTWLNALANHEEQQIAKRISVSTQNSSTFCNITVSFSVHGWCAVRSDKRRPQRRIDYPKRCQKCKQLDLVRRIVVVDMPRVHCYFNWDWMERFISVDALKSNYLPIVLLLRWIVRLAGRARIISFIKRPHLSLVFMTISLIHNDVIAHDHWKSVLCSSFRFFSFRFFYCYRLIKRRLSLITESYNSFHLLCSTL